MTVILVQAVFKDKIHFNSHYPGADILPNTCNVSILGPGLQGNVIAPEKLWHSEIVLLISQQLA